MAPVRQPPIWPNGDATIASESSSHRNINLDSRYAVTPAASGAAAPIITARKSPGTPNTARYAWIVLRNGAPATPITGSVIASCTAERNRQQQHVRDQKQRLRDLANNNSVFNLKHSAAEIWLLGAGLQNLANNNSVPAQVWILEALPPRKPPVSESCKQQRPGSQAVSAG
jgi:hypothetical protein